VLGKIRCDNLTLCTWIGLSRACWEIFHLVLVNILALGLATC